LFNRIESDFFLSDHFVRVVSLISPAAKTFLLRFSDFHTQPKVFPVTERQPSASSGVDRILRKLAEALLVVDVTKLLLKICVLVRCEHDVTSYARKMRCFS